jgi:3-dehydroquinate dehydratase/shikimate dehydrogenase
MDAESSLSRVIPSVLEADADAAGASLEALPQRYARVELRADRLGAAAVERLARLHGSRLIVAVRRAADGGGYRGTEEGRVALLRAALGGGAGHVDLEWNSAAAGLLAEPGYAGRAILSHHGGPCDERSLTALYDEMAAAPAAVLKIVPRAERASDVAAVRILLQRATREGRALACFALGRSGALSRLLAPGWGSWATYGTPRSGAETAEGQYRADDLADIHGVETISPATRLYALLGSSVGRSPSPAMHRAGYGLLGLDARYLPLELDRLEELEALLDTGAAEFCGFGVTMPLKEDAARRCRRLDAAAETAGAVNTVRVAADGWHGFNTDGPAALALVRERLDPVGLRVALLGAGGTARAVGAALAGAGAEVTLFNRQPDRAATVAAALGLRASESPEPGEGEWDLLVNATPRGSAGERFLDPARLTGSGVLDAVYRPGSTALAADARERDLAVIDGFELLAAQAALQFHVLTGRTVKAAEIAAAGMQWLDDRTA